MSKFYQTKQFEDLNAEWKEKLKKSGFEDIEQDDENLKVWISQFFKVRSDPTTDAAKTEYYRLAGQFLFDHKFKTKRDRTVWELHAQGHSSRSIAKLLRPTWRTANRHNVGVIVHRLFKIMSYSWNK